MIWKEALQGALKNRTRRDLYRAVFVAIPATVIGSYDKSVVTGLLLGAWVGVGVFVSDIVFDAHKALKRARTEASRVSD